MRCGDGAEPRDDDELFSGAAPGAGRLSGSPLTPESPDERPLRTNKMRPRGGEDLDDELFALLLTESGEGLPAGSAAK